MTIRYVESRPPSARRKAVSPPALNLRKALEIAGSPNWEGTGKIFCLREDLRQELRRFQGRAPAWLLGAW
eukprot:scaffold502_cov115-Isochrysis_galbana.AAC.6